MKKKHRVLFVDDEPMVLQGFECMLYNMRGEWDMEFVDSGAKALEVMDKDPVDVIISDMRMPKMNGAQLLNETMKRHPQTARFILSGYTDKQLIMSCINGMHQFLSKPVYPDILRETVRKALEIDTWLPKSSIKDLVLGLEILPTLPSLYYEVMKAIDSPDCDVEQVAATIAKDPGMTAKLLQMANSTFFAKRENIVSPVEAVKKLGAETVKSLILGMQVFSHLDSQDKPPPIEQLWNHSLLVGKIAKQIAIVEKCSQAMIDEAFTAGLLHGIGKLILALNMPEDYDKAFTITTTEKIPIWEAEQRVFDTNHAELGGYLLGLWGLPATMVEAIGLYHQPGKSVTKAFGLLTCVHVANVLAFEQQLLDLKPFFQPELDLEYLKELGLEGRLEEWKKLVEKCNV